MLTTASRKRPAEADIMFALRSPTSSFSSDASDELDAIDRILEAEEAAAANEMAKQRRTVEPIKQVDLDCVSEDIYERMEEEAMLEMLASLEHEMIAEYAAECARGASPPASTPLLWDVVATPQMMTQFSQTVRHTVSGLC